MHQTLRTIRIGILFFLTVSLARAASLRVEPVNFEQETLDNGLRVIYAPLTAPVVHVRVLYHVGSRDERPDRQGFAHMFEHMMFRGSAHVKPEEHMKLIGIVGGYSNAFTSYDQTVYLNTIPSEHLEMALYLEADRMASFKVSDNIFQTEREVVQEEWRMKQNRPYGHIWDALVRTGFTTHRYRWTPIGDMDELRASRVERIPGFLQHLLPAQQCRADHHRRHRRGKDPVDGAEVFHLDSQGLDVPRSPAGTRTTESRQLIVYKPNVPLTNVYMAFKTADYRSDDHYALGLLGDILSSGETGRLDRKFVNGESAASVQVSAEDYQLEDQSLFILEAVVQQGKDPAQVSRDILATYVRQRCDSGGTGQGSDGNEAGDHPVARDVFRDWLATRRGRSVRRQCRK